MLHSNSLIGYDVPSPSLIKRLTKGFFYLTLITVIAILFFGFLPSPISQLFSGSLKKAEWQLRTVNKEAQGVPASIPVYLFDNGLTFEFVLPVYTVVTTPQGRYAINWGKTFGYEFIMQKPALLPEAWNFPDYTFPVTATPQPPSTSPLPVAQKAIETNTSWCVIGWGQKDFFTSTAPAKLLSVQPLARMLWGGEAVMHVDIMEGTFSPQTALVLYVTDAEYIALCDYIHRSMAKDTSGAPRPLFTKGKGDLDCFFKGSGTYSLFNNSTTWISKGLKTIAAPAPLWTPFPFFIRWHQPK